MSNSTNKNRDNTRNKYGRLKHTHVPRILQNNMPPFFEVYSMGGDAVFTIAANDVIHLPNDYLQRFSKGHNQHNNHRLIFCPHFHKCLLLNNNNNNNNTEDGGSSNDQNVGDETPSSCPFGEECSHVHAYLGNAKINSDIHINFAYRNLHEVRYDRYDFHSTAPLRVAPPNATSPSEDLPAHLCIRTSAYIARDRIPSHCAHYYFNRICNRGSRCFFVHAVSLQMNSGEIINNTDGDDSKGNGGNSAAEGQYYVDPFYRCMYGRTETLRRNGDAINSNSKNNNNINNIDSTSKTACEGEQKQPRCQSFAAQAASPSINISIPCSEQQLKPRCQSFAAFPLPRSVAVIVRNNNNNNLHRHHHHVHDKKSDIVQEQQQQQQQQQPQPLCRASLVEFEKPMSKGSLVKPVATKAFSCNDSVSSVSVSSCSTPVPDEIELANETDNNSNNNINIGTCMHDCHTKNTKTIEEHYQQHDTPKTGNANAAVATTFPTTPNSPNMVCPGCKKFVHNPYSWTETTVCLVYESPTSN